METVSCSGILDKNHPRGGTPFHGRAARVLRRPVAFGSVYRFAGSERAYVAPSSTHFASCRLVRTSSGSTRSHPCILRPRISMRRALVVATSLSDCAGSTRTNTPPWLLAATAMLPPMRKASPPNIFFSVSPDSAPSSSRMRSASSSSYATAAIVHQGGSDLPSCWCQLAWVGEKFYDWGEPKGLYRPRPGPHEHDDLLAH
jgi:hypothetical protein